jgi:hypothetical protein
MCGGIVLKYLKGIHTDQFCGPSTVHVQLVPGHLSLGLIDRLVEGSGPFSPDAPRPYMSRPFVPQSFPHRSPTALLKRHMAPRFVCFMSSGSKKKEPKCPCLLEAKASHLHRMWAEVSSSAPHFLQSGLSLSPIKWRCLYRVLCLVRSLVTTLDCSLLSDKSLTLVPRLGPKINS